MAFRIKIDSACAAIRGEHVNRHFADRVCTGYSPFVRSRATIYRDRLKTLFSDVQMRGINFDWLCIRAIENSHSRQLEEPDYRKENSNRITPCRDDADEVQVFTIPAGLSQFTFYIVRLQHKRQFIIVIEIWPSAFFVLRHLLAAWITWVLSGVIGRGFY